MSKNYAVSDVPIIRHSRSRFDLSHGVKTSGNVGTLYPFEVQEVYAGDTFKINTSVVCRLSSQFIRPVMDNLFLDVYYFYVPSRILYDKFVNIFGENTESKWANTVEYQVPAVGDNAVSTVVSKTVADYLGLPVGLQSNDCDISLLPFRAFAKIYDDWFRDQNNVDPMHIQVGEANTNEVFNNNPWSPNNYMGQLPKVAKMHDYFTSCLPSAQKGDPVTFGVNSGLVPVGASSRSHNVGRDVALRVNVVGDGGSDPIGSAGGVLAYGAGDSALNPNRPSRVVGMTSSEIPNSEGFSFSNLWLDSSALQSISVNELRYAFQTQKMLERAARSGSRFVEYLKSSFGVSAGDYRLQRSEYLGGRRIPISIQQVVQSTGSGSTTSPLGELGAFSQTGGSSRVTKSFVENGYVIGVFCIRQFHTYQQGVERFWNRLKRTEFFDPVFSHIGEQPVFKTELFYNAGAEVPFGYQEAWADLRTRPNRITGQLRSGVTNSLDVWHFADLYANAPTLNQQFIEETPTYVNRTITVESTEQDQFILDFWVKNIAYRVLPTYSVPSLIDHD